MGIPPMGTQTPSHGCLNTGGLVWETPSLVELGYNSESQNFMEKLGSSFMPMVWASHGKGHGAPQPGLMEH